MPAPRKLLTFAVLALAAGGAAGCGTKNVELAESDPNYRGAQLFAERCSGCHSLKVVGAEGSATKINDRERVDGPNFDTRREDVADVLYAIRNGGFSGALMPQNIVTGDEAQQVAEFLAEYAGGKRDTPESPTSNAETG